MASEDPARMGVAIQVTGKALFIAGDTGELGRVDDVLGRSRLGVLVSGSVTGLAGLALPASLRPLVSMTWCGFFRKRVKISSWHV